jgi:hypothetical protein
LETDFKNQEVPTVPREPVTIPDTHQLDWQVLPTARDGNVPGPVFKVLAEDTESGARTRLLHCPPGWHDDELDWHPSVEEAITLAGSMRLGDCVMDTDCYLYRPPGVLHGPVYGDRRVGATFLIRMDRPSRILRYDGDKFPHRHAQPISDEYMRSPFTWYEKLDTHGIPYLPAPDGPWAGTRVKWLNRHRETGGGAVMLELPPGWRGAGSAARGEVEEFVLDGAVEAGGERFVKWGYACRSAGAPAGEYRTEEGARLICWWDVDELA